MNTRNLVIVFVVLLVLVVATRLFKNRGDERTFRDNLVSIDTARVSGISLYPKSDRGAGFRFERTGPDWTVSGGGQTFEADKRGVNIMLRTLNDLNTDQVAARSKERWPEFQVNDSSATRVVVEEDGEPVADVYIGRFFVQQNIQDARSYIRLGDEEDVYMVPGLLSLSFDRGLSSWRNRNVVSLEPDEVTRVVFEYPADSGFVLTMPDSTWMLDGGSADSASVVQYLGRLRNLINQQFVEDGRTVSAPEYVVRLEGPAMETIRVQAEATVEGNEFLIASTDNPQATWSSDPEGLFATLFRSRATFLPD